MTDPQEFSQYEQSAGAAATGQPLTPLAFYGALDTLEGPPVDGAVVLAFPTIAAARAWDESSRYQPALAHRVKGAE